MKFRSKMFGREMLTNMEAFQYFPDFTNFPGKWMDDALADGRASYFAGEDPHYEIAGLLGPVRAEPGDWIACFRGQDLAVFKPEAFDEQVEVVEDDAEEITSEPSNDGASGAETPSEEISPVPPDPVAQAALKAAASAAAERTRATQQRLREQSVDIHRVKIRGSSNG